MCESRFADFGGTAVSCSEAEFSVRERDTKRETVTKSRAQLVLRTAVGFSLKDEEHIHWKIVGNNLAAVLSCETLLRDAQARFVPS